jgi:protein-S-isoprenylcysteine O-methyltransferase Ste14
MDQPRPEYATHPRASKKPTWRKMAVYLSAVLLLACADPRCLTYLLGCIFVGLAWLLRIWSFGHLEKNRLMVTTGPYAHTRNPAYLGSFVALFGVVLAAGNWESPQGQGVWVFGVLLAIAFFTFYFPRKMSKEYPRLKELFGEQVERHAQNVPDFWPRLRPWRSGDDRRFSWQRVGANHEWGWGVVLALILVTIWFAPQWSPLHFDSHS